jgi:asparagine synthase (glutamine-hydrolysing)
MAVGLESRLPLLDHRVVEFALGLPLDLKVRDGQGKWLLRQVLHAYVPEPLVDRAKQGFGVPIGRWLREDLREWAEDLLSVRRLEQEGVFEPALIRAAWDEHCLGVRDRHSMLWDVLMFQLWYTHAWARA